MTWVVVLALLGDTLVLKEKASPSGKFVALLDLVDVDRLGPATRAALARVYLGRAPEEGQSRTITAEEVKKELERRGYEVAAYPVEGEKVVVAYASGSEPRVGESVRKMIAFEIRKHLLETTRGLRAHEFVVRVSYLSPETFPPEADVVEIATRDQSNPKAMEFTATLQHDGKKFDVLVVARMLRLREVAFATREIRAQHTLTREDVEMKRIEVDDTDRYVEDVSALVGAKAQTKIAKGTVIERDAVKLKPTVRRGENVMARSRFLDIEARAIEEGGVGDVITLEYPGTRSRFRGRIVSASVVEVVEEEKK